jgi:arylacetamide deacetylase-like 2
MKYEKIFSTMATFYIIQAVSDENVTVFDTDFNNSPVPLYLPKRKA